MEKPTRTVEIDISATYTVDFCSTEYKDHTDEELVEIAIYDAQQDSTWLHDDSLNFKGGITK